VIREGCFHFDPNDGIYRDHFPGHPIVPGSLIVQAFVEAIESDARGPLDLSGFRFKRFLAPGTYRFQIDEKPEHIDCRLYDGGKTVVTGKVRRCN
jgi:3-hydroxyacyl-[acyl-carrier-protein] dehydratase